MKRTVLLVMFSFLCGAVFAFAETDAEVNARKNALDVAGAFTNEGFKLRGKQSNQRYDVFPNKQGGEI